jgi:3-deoxy-D-manno-octulosonic-acid transferase
VYFLIYNLILSLTLVAALPFLPVWLALRPRFRPGLAERFGWFDRSKLQKLKGTRPIWIHAASVGEVFAANTLMVAAKAKLPERKVIISTFTDTGNEMARRCAGADAAFFLPLDYPLIVRRALVEIDPAVLIVIETEIWPNLLREAFKLGIPILLLSGRLSDRSLRRYLIFRGLFQSVLRCFTVLGMQSEEDAGRIKQLGAESKRVKVTGNLKRAGRASVFRDDTAAKPNGGSAAAQARRPLLVAGSSHPGEEDILLRVFVELKKQFHDLQLAIAPRHPGRFAEVEQLLLRIGLNFQKKSKIEECLSFNQDVMLIDTLGDLGRFYARADITFVGGSLVKVGGHNLLEPAFFKKPVLFGPYIENFRMVAAELLDSGGGIQIRDADDLLREIAGLLGDPEKRQTIGEKAYRVAAKDGSVVERNLDLLLPYLGISADHEMRVANRRVAAARE